MRRQCRRRRRRLARSEPKDLGSSLNELERQKKEAENVKNATTQQDKEAAKKIWEGQKKEVLSAQCEMEYV